MNHVKWLFLFLVSGLLSCKTLTLYTEVAPESSLIIGGYDRLGFTTTISNKSNKDLKLLSRNKLATKDLMVVAGRSKKELETPDYSELIIKNLYAQPIRVKVGIAAKESAAVVRKVSNKQDLF